MAGRFSFSGPFAFFLLASCSFDTSGFKASGSGGTMGSGSSASTVTNGVTTNATTATNATTNTSTTNATTVTSTTNATTATSTTNATTATSTTNATTATTSTTTVATTATTVATTATTVATTATTGGPLNLPFCQTGSPPKAVTDNFNTPTFNPYWNAINASDTNGHAVITMQGGNPGSLFLKAMTDMSAECALTVDLVSSSGGEQRFRLNISATMPFARIKYANQVLSFANATDSPQVSPPFTLAYVSHGGQLYAAYKVNGAWTRFDQSTPIAAATASLSVGMTEENGGNGDSGSWDNFNLTQLSLMDIGL